MNNNLVKNKIKTGKLDNGIKYIYNNNSFYSSCCIVFYIRVGAIHETEKYRGISHLLEHMLFKGTKKYQTFMDLNKKFDIINCSVNAATSKNYTYIDMKLPYQNLEEGLELLNEMIFNSLILEIELEKEKKVIYEEFNRTFDDHQTRLEILTTEFNFKNHRLSNLILGSKKSVKEITRKDIMNYYKKYYIPRNSCISIVGNVPKNLLKILNKIFILKSSKTINHKIIEYKHPKNNNFLYKSLKTKLNHISISFPLFTIFDIRKYYLDILIDILGGNMTSRLWVALREKNQLVYSFNLFYECYEDGGFFSINFSCANKNVKKTINTIIEILKSLKEIGISLDELKMTQKKSIMDIELNSEESCEISEFYGEQIILDTDLKNYNDIKKIYEKCSIKIISDLCKTIFNFSKMKIILLGNFPEKDLKKIIYKID